MVELEGPRDQELNTKVDVGLVNIHASTALSGAVKFCKCCANFAWISSYPPSWSIFNGPYNNERIDNGL